VEIYCISNLKTPRSLHKLERVSLVFSYCLERSFLSKLFFT